MEEQSDTPETDAAEREDAGPITHAIRGWNYARKHERERDEALDVLRRNGFVLCDIAACNCGSWHARYGIPERMAEIKDALTEAGHPMTNENGHLPIKALAELVKERDEARAEIERLITEVERLRGRLIGKRAIFQAGRDSYKTNCQPMNTDDEAWAEFVVSQEAKP